MSSAARLDAAYGDMGESVESTSLDAFGCPSSSTAHSPYTLPEEASTNDRHPLAAARSRSTAVDDTLATTAPSGSSKDPLTPERAPHRVYRRLRRLLIKLFHLLSLFRG